MSKDILKVVEIYETIDGEVNLFHQGRMTTILRLAGCNLKPGCSYCDSKYACDSVGIEMTAKEVCDKIREIGNTNITITGGEPLLQGKALKELFNWFGFYSQINYEYSINIETNGTIDPLDFNWDRHIRRTETMDYKLPSSRIKIDKIDLNNFHYVHTVKFIIADEVDYNHALKIKQKLQNNNCHSLFAFSPVMFTNEEDKERFTKRTGIKDIWTPKELFNRLRRDKQHENVIFNVQLHKLVGLK